jgi:hypothetical protein
MLLFLTAVTFAFAVGGRVERFGALILVGGLLATWSAQAIVHDRPLIFALIDFLGAASFAVLALKAPEKLWPGVAACSQLLVSVFSATRALEFPLSFEAYVLMLNVSGLGVVAALVAGTTTSRWFPRPADEWDVAAERLSSAPSRSCTAS